jgi:nucleoside-diphosphate-sugar epimerase
MRNQKILITGDKGYIGSVLSEVLISKGYEVTGLDACFFEDCLVSHNVRNYHTTKKDIREINSADVTGFYAIVHLAGLSNDPLGEVSPGLTEDINLRSTLKLAELAKKAGVERFIYASSQSMYGIAKTDIELDEDDSEKNPVTAYARTKWEAEVQLKNLTNDSFNVICFRPSTVFGASPRLRCDIVFNSLVACAFTTGKIEIKSDGTPWRPVIHVRDVSNAFIAGIQAPLSLVSNRSFNVGIPNGNYTVRDLAEAAAKSVPGSSLVFTGEHGNDSRSYRVSFNRILTELKDWYKPEWNLDRGGAELVDFFRTNNFTESDFRGIKTNRLMKLTELQKSGIINSDLRWIS